jgi:hypothetical protein
MIKCFHKKRDDRHKIYSLHEPMSIAWVEPETNKPYEFGCKSIRWCHCKTGIIVAVTSFEENKNDVYTLEQMEQINC